MLSTAPGVNRTHEAVLQLAQCAVQASCRHLCMKDTQHFTSMDQVLIALGIYLMLPREDLVY